MVGLLLAMILGATMSSISSEMNALATESVIDIYKRHARTEAPEGHYLLVSRCTALLWGGYAVISAQLKRSTCWGRFSMGEASLDFHA
jgi:SSS family solute:Na+ symporter